MAKRRNLKGLPHNLTKSFFGTERYYKHGYMADWIFNAAKRRNLAEVTIDILGATVIPDELNLYPVVLNIRDLKAIIEKELSSNGFPKDFIVEAKIKVKFRNAEIRDRAMYCYPYLVDEAGFRYESEGMFEYAYEDYFDPFSGQVETPDNT